MPKKTSTAAANFAPGESEIGDSPEISTLDRKTTINPPTTKEGIRKMNGTR